ncbi:MAG: hypothetical protein Q4D14_03275, partial [Bacteroidales bacterium]|nr:hypothetical protein [Bacteroidales bacterium]
MGKKKYTLFALFMLLSMGNVFAQNPQVSATIDSTALLIGEQAHIVYKVQNSKGTIVPPVFTDTIVDKLEIVERSIDTLNNESGATYCYNFVVTAFDSALFYIPQMPFLIDGDTFFSNDLSLKVVTIPVDTVDLAITDIKDIERAPFNWKEWAEYVLYIVLALLFVFICF